MSRTCAWVDDFTLEALPDLVDGLTEAGVMVMRSFSRVPNPAMVGQLADHPQIAMVSGRDFNQLVARIETATTTLRIGVMAVLPLGVEAVTALRGPGVVDVIPARSPGAARRVVLMSKVPIVTGARAAPLLRAAAPGGQGGVGPARRAEARAVAVASSTGGCWVLAELLKSVGAKSFPVLLAQHLDSEFVDFFAQWLQTTTGWRTQVVDAPAALESGVVYLPSGGRDLCVDREQHAYAAASVSRFVPNADRLFTTFAEAFGAKAMGVVLSGMGSDGARGLAEIARRGGRALCQLPGSAIVPSMPESALRAAAGATALPPELLGTALLQD